ncbi:MAG: terminase family protein [Pseudomonadota bacterium]
MPALLPEPRGVRGADLSRYIQTMPPSERATLIGALGVDEAEAYDGDWPSWAHDGQRAPPGDWRTWVIMAGRGFGKTRAGAQWIADIVAQPGAVRIALVAATLDEARRVMIEGPSGLLNIAGDMVTLWAPSRRLLRFTNGAEATLYSGASPDALRGPEHHFAWCDELAKWEKPAETWDMLQLGMRLGECPRVLVTTTPRQGALLSAIIASDGCELTRGATRANPHLPGAFVETVEALYGGTRLGRQELEGELLPDIAGALWSVDLIERCRMAGNRPLLIRTVIGVDPPSGDGTCGIVACGIDGTGIGYVLADHSVTARSPEGWAGAVAAAAEAHNAGLIIAETNQGGAMVEAVLRSADATLRVKAVQAILGKSERATPIAARFAAGKIMLCGRFPEMEAELCGLIAGGGYEGPGRSPDRADACVWALTELMTGKGQTLPRITRF